MSCCGPGWISIQKSPAACPGTHPAQVVVGSLVVLLCWLPPHFSQGPLTTGKVTNKVSPCPGEVPPALELVLSSLEQVVPQVGGQTPPGVVALGGSICAASEHAVHLGKVTVVGVCPFVP